jgi:hypothetical protein
MLDDIDEAKRNATDLIGRLKTESESLRLGLVTYRDLAEDGPGHLDKVCGLTQDVSSIAEAVRGIQAIGGGDPPEDVLDGLQRALSMDWRPGVVKLVVLMGDAPAKDPDHEGKTKKTIADFAEAVDPAHVYALALSGAAMDDFRAVAEMTGGRAFAVAETAGLTAAIEETVKQAIAAHAEEATGFVGGGGMAPTAEPWETPTFAVLVVANLVLAAACVVVWQQRRRPGRAGQAEWAVQVREPRAPARRFTCRTSVLRLGRALGNDIVLRDPKVSGVHAELRWGGRGWVVTDLASRNGTWVNGRRVNTCPVAPGHPVRVGDTVVVPLAPPNWATPTQAQVRLR